MDKDVYKLNNGRATLRNPTDCSVLWHSFNRVYLVRATSFTQIPPLRPGTLDTLGTLVAIGGLAL